MTFLRNLWRDLVEKRLWPVAAALVVALVAVPVIVGTGSSEVPDADLPAVAANATPPTAAQVSLDTTVTTKPQNRKGAVRDPFKPLHVVEPKTGATGAATATVPAGIGTTPAAGTTKTPAVTTPGKTTGSTGGSGSTGSGSTGGGSKGGADLVPLQWVASVRLGSHTAMKTYKNVSGLTLLPSPSYNLVTFLGVKKDFKTAAFLVRSGTLVTGDGTCVPSPGNCEMVEIAEGKSVLLTRRAGSTGLKRYRVRLLSLKMRRMPDSVAKTRGAGGGLAVDARSLSQMVG